MQVKPNIDKEMSHPEKAQAFYKAGFKAIDGTRRGDASVLVSANDLIDVCIAYADARKGDTDNLEWALAVASAEANQARKMLAQIADLLPVDSPAWDVAMKDPWGEYLDLNGEPCAREVANGILKKHGAPTKEQPCSE